MGIKLGVDSRKTPTVKKVGLKTYMNRQIASQPSNPINKK